MAALALCLPLVCVRAQNSSGTSADAPKPDIKELMKGSSFTNSSGVVMVKISDTLWAGQYHVTQAEYQKVMGSNPSRFRGDRNPVDSVSWTDAMAFCSRLSETEQKDKMLPEKMVYSLPTQAMWERLVAGAGLDTAVTRANGNHSSTAPVGSLRPNSLGLYDIRGNLWQWCLDPQDKPFRVLRGAAWNSFIEVNLRIDFRWFSNGPDERKETFGFRCVLVPE